MAQLLQLRPHHEVHPLTPSGIRASPTASLLRHWGRCARPCLKKDSELPDHTISDHFCVLKIGHSGRCDYIRTCKASLA